MKRLACMSLLALLLAACEKPAQQTTQSSNPEIKVELLFVHDGVKVYRFSDSGRFIYYADARGQTRWDETNTTGKTTVTTPQTVTTVK